jgi:molybdopterin molybdotransferase
MALISVEEATHRLLSGVAMLQGERALLDAAAWRTLAAPVKALRTQPPFPASAMDGYAVNPGSDPNHYTVIGESAAGRGFAGSISAGQAVRIFTGAPVPEGATAIVIQEQVERLENGSIRLTAPLVSGKHIRKRGLDFTEGETVLPPGRVLDPAALSLAAACGHPELQVVRRPKLFLLATGDELVAPGATPGPDQIVASNGFGTAALARKLGADVTDLGIIPDDETQIRTAVESAISFGADIIVTLGGASVGDHDLIRPVLASLGVNLDFWQIAMRPGKPLMYGKSGRTHILGLPGNPVSSLVCGQLFLAPLIAALSGRPFSQTIIKARLAVPMPPNDHRQDYVRASIDLSDIEPLVTPFPVQDSSMLTTLAASNGLIIRPPQAEAAEIGEKVDVLMLRGS